MRARLALIRVARIVLAAVAVVFAAVCLLLFVMWREHVTAVTLPDPTGSFAVGRRLLAWKNPAGAELAVWVWYPAARSDRDAPADYLPPAWRAALRDRQATL